jgi:RNA polymerase sigma factor (sigma-70 family)
MEQIAKRAINGDEQAILSLLQYYEETLYKTAYAYLRNEQDALDAMQELAYRALKKLHQVKEPAYAGTWLVRVLINICLDMKKKQPKHVSGHREPIYEQKTDFEVLDLIRRLPEQEQQAIYLKYVEQWTNKDIAKLQNIPEGTVKSRVHHALKKLRLLFGQGGGQ